MKHTLITFLLCVSAFCMAMQANDSTGLADKIIIIPHIAVTSEIPPRAQDLMMEKMKQILLRNGVVDISDRSRFVLTVKSSVTDQGWTDTTPAKYAMVVEFTFYIGDVESGLLFANKMLRRKAVGNSEEEAYMQAVKSIRATDPVFKMLIDSSKQRIIETLDAREEKLIFDGDNYNINWW